jgi:small-conductance mechanosensitive channel
MELLGEKLFDLAMAAVILLIGVVLIKLILRFTRKILEKSSLDESVYLFITRATKVALWAVLIIAILTMIGIPAASLVTVLGAGGAAIALALKDSLGNVAGGILILINKGPPFFKSRKTFIKSLFFAYNCKENGPDLLCGDKIKMLVG